MKITNEKIEAAPAIPLYTFIITQDGVERARIEHEPSEYKALGAMQRLQHHNYSHAIRYEGWKVEQIDEATKESWFWKPLTRMFASDERFDREKERPVEREEEED